MDGSTFLGKCGPSENKVEGKKVWRCAYEDKKTDTITNTHAHTAKGVRAGGGGGGAAPWDLSIFGQNTCHFGRQPSFFLFACQLFLCILAYSPVTLSHRKELFVCAWPRPHPLPLAPLSEFSPGKNSRTSICIQQHYTLTSTERHARARKSRPSFFIFLFYKHDYYI